MTSSPPYDVLIVGAGPVGLLLAIELTIAGVRPVVIGRRSGDSAHSKASIIWPRILELMNRCGLDKTLIEHGHCFDEMNYYSNARKIGRMQLSKMRDTPYPFGITIPQWKTEDILHHQAMQLGVEINNDLVFVSGNQTQNYVEAHLQKPSGDITIAQSRWLIGADGFRSAVREAFGFDFGGFAMPTQLAITDAEILGNADTSELAYFLHESGNLVLAPLGGGVFRVGASVPKDHDRNAPLDHQFFEDLVQKRTKRHIALGKMRFSGIFTAHVKSASVFQKGRVFLAGDAAHAMSPSGAQGLNTGFQDAFNLGWKLASVIKGRVQDSILETYSIERKLSVERVSRLSTQLARISLIRSPVTALIRDVAMAAASSSGVLDRQITRRIAQFDTSIENHPSARPLLRKSEARHLAGRRLPLLWQTQVGEPSLSITHFSILLWPGLSYSFRDWEKTVQQISGSLPYVSIVDLAGKPLGLLRNFVGSAPFYIVARPDGHVARSGYLDEINTGEIASAIDQFFIKYLNE